MQARLVNDKNVYQNYFLCIKSDKPHDVEIDIVQNPPPELKEEPPLIPPPLIPPVMQPVPVKKSSIFTWKTLLIILAIIGIGVGLYYLWGNGGTKAILKVCKDTTSDVVGDVIPTSPVKIETPSVNTKASSPGLISRLKGMVEE